MRHKAITDLHFHSYCNTGRIGSVSNSGARRTAEVWLTQGNIEVTGRVIREDESTESLAVLARSLAGAQREVTGGYVAEGWQPVGRWVTTLKDADGLPLESNRRFVMADAPVTA